MRFQTIRRRRSRSSRFARAIADTRLNVRTTVWLGRRLGRTARHSATWKVAKARQRLR
jgi:hypothetical protein